MPRENVLFARRARSLSRYCLGLSNHPESKDDGLNRFASPGSLSVVNGWRVRP